MVDEVPPGPVPQTQIVIPVAGFARSIVQPPGGGDGFGLDPEIFRRIGEAAVRPVAIDKPAMIPVPPLLHRRIEQ